MNQGMTREPRIITYRDELLADKSVRRTFSDGHYEWRRRLPDGRVQWQDNQGYSGIDEVLNETIIKRTFSNGAVIYGCEQGYGRTAWSGGGRVVTVNQSSFGGRVGMILASIGAGMLLGSIVWPPDSLSAMEEEALREQMRQQMRQASTSSSSNDSESDWDDSGDDVDDSNAVEISLLNWSRRTQEDEEDTEVSYADDAEGDEADEGEKWDPDEADWSDDAGDDWGGDSDSG